MTATLSHGSPVCFQLASASTWADPWPMYKALRDHDPVHRVVPADRPDHDYYVMSRHADIWAAARDHETFSSAQGLTVNYGALDLIGLADNPPFVMQDPPVHTEFRKLVSRGFTPRQVDAVEPKVRESVVEALGGLPANGGGDIVAELFKPLPSMVVAHYLGVPEEDRNQFDGWTEAIVAANTTDGGAAGALGGLGDALGEMMAYFTALIERRRLEPEDDTVSHLVATGVGGHAVDPRLHIHDGHRRQRHHDRHARRHIAIAPSAARPAPAAGREPRPDPGRGRRVPAPDVAGAGPGPHHYQRCHHRRRHHSCGAQGAAALRGGQPRRA